MGTLINDGRANKSAEKNRRCEPICHIRSDVLFLATQSERGHHHTDGGREYRGEPSIESTCRHRQYQSESAASLFVAARRAYLTHSTLRLPRKQAVGMTLPPGDIRGDRHARPQEESGIAPRSRHVTSARGGHPPSPKRRMTTAVRSACGARCAAARKPSITEANSSTIGLRRSSSASFARYAWISAP
jgi:hypothetical protein